MRKEINILLFLMPLIIQVSVQGQTPDNIRLIDEIFAEYHNGMPGLAVAVEREGKVIYDKAFGLADMEHLVPNTTSTIFECGSVSKQFTAASVLLLAQDGKLSLQDDVRKYVPELPQYDAPITIQNLLNHTSGLKDWGALYSLTGWSRTTRVYTQDLGFDIVFRQKSLNFTPGSEYSYSNSNYVMLVLIIERVSGKSLAEFTEERLFSPLGMNDTQWRDNYREIVPDRAVAYSGSQGRFLQNMPFENLHGPGGLLSTTSDLLKWNRLLETNELFNNNIARLRIEPGLLTNGRSSGYAAGLMIGTLNGFDEICHSGSTAGYRAWLAWYPEQKLSIAILSNYASFNPTSMGRAVAGVFLGQAPEQPRTAEPDRSVTLTEADLTRWAGIYYSASNNEVLRIESREGSLYTGNQRYRALHSDTLYRGGQRYIFSPGNIITSGRTTYVRVAPAKTDAESLSEYTGRYYCEEVDVTYSIDVTEGGLRIFRYAGDTYRITPQFLDAFSSGSGFYRFTRDRRGRITGFEVSVSRASRVPFRKL
ncbi:MAG: serine hydrolase [Bacteroidales bacterium]|jgi:CubicO group peptidase (beta-lactamase class C family)|nr:serine hydrolase [Bacteroidales bacterium]